MKNITTMVMELQSFKTEHTKLAKQFHKNWKKGKINDRDQVNRFNFLNRRVKNLYININQAIQKNLKH